MTRDSRHKLLSWIESDHDRLIGFLQKFTRIDTSNPPGDTRDATAFLCRFLDEQGLPYRIVAPQEMMPNIVSSFDCGGSGRHLILNGHIDVFPAGDLSFWTRDPWCGDIIDGRVFGRGTVDMKCGTTASLFTYAYLHRLREELKGKLTLTIVSDEETGGRWGAGYLLENCADEVMGDCVLNGETFRVRAPGGHGAYPHLSASATKIAARLIVDLDRLETLLPHAPDKVSHVLNQPEVRAAIEQGLGKGAADVAQKVTVNIGTVHGGVKVNMLPGECVIEADVRVPIGLDKDDVLAEVAAILKGYPEVSLEPLPAKTVKATWCDPEHEMVEVIQDIVEESLGSRLICSSPSRWAAPTAASGGPRGCRPMYMALHPKAWASLTKASALTSFCMS